MVSQILKYGEDAEKNVLVWRSPKSFNFFNPLIQSLLDLEMFYHHQIRVECKLMFSSLALCQLSLPLVACKANKYRVICMSGEHFFSHT